MAGIENRLTAALYRATCPDPIELGEHYLGMLAEERSAFIQQHLTECPHCKRELRQLQSYLAEVEHDLEYTLADHIKIWIARLVPGHPVVSSAPRPALALRGDAGDSFVYEAGDAQLIVEVHDDPEWPGRKCLLGLVVGIETAELQAHLWQDDELVATVAVDELGNFIISDLSPGHYELILAAPTVEIHVQDLAI